MCNIFLFEQKINEVGVGMLKTVDFCALFVKLPFLCGAKTR